MDLIKKNLKLKIIVVFLAFLCWSYVMAKVNPTITREYRNIPVNLRNIENLYKKNLMVIDPKEPRVNVTLRGRRKWSPRRRCNRPGWSQNETPPASSGPPSATRRWA